MPDCPSSPILAITPPMDFLSAPTGDDLVPAILALLPVGAAWGTPDGEASDPDRRMTEFWAAFADVMAEHYARLHQIKAESTTVTLVGALEDWETELGLPDPCFGADQTVEARLRAVRARVLAQQIDDLGDYECLAAALGYTVAAARATLPFRAGSRVGDRLGDPTAACWVVMTIGPLGPAVPFRVGNSRVGDRLLDFATATVLECVFERVKPVEWNIRYDYS